MDGGSTLVLYTDGLVEVPGESIDAGLARLKDAVVAGPEEPEALCDHVIDSLIGGGAARDDVAFLALRTLPLSSAPLRLELPTNPQGLVNLRRTLGRWLAGNGATRREASDISLACHEACANAIEHGYGFRKGSFRVEASLEGEEIALRVRDDGAWRPPGETDRGQGLGLMRTLMDSVEVEAGASGTTVELRRRLGARTKRARSGAASV